MKTSIGIQAKKPKKACIDKKCPYHSNLSVRGMMFTGTVVSAKRHNTVTVEWARRAQLPKFERYEKRKTKVSVHNPECIAAKEGDLVRIMSCKPLSKTKNFVVIENLGHVFGYQDRMEALAASKVKEKSRKEEQEIFVQPIKKEIDEEKEEQ